MITRCEVVGGVPCAGNWVGPTRGGWVKLGDWGELGEKSDFGQFSCGQLVELFLFFYEFRPFFPLLLVPVGEVQISHLA